MSSIADSIELSEFDRLATGLRFPGKPFTTRGRSRLRGHRRTRGHVALEKHDGSPRHSGRRFVALARATVIDLATGAVEFLESQTEEDDEPPRPVVGYSQNSYQYEEARAREDIQEVDEHQRIKLLALEADLQQQALRGLEILSNPLGFEDRVAVLEQDPDIGDHDIAVALEQMELDVDYALCAA